MLPDRHFALFLHILFSCYICMADINPPINLRAIYYNTDYSVFAWDKPTTGNNPSGYKLVITSAGGGFSKQVDTDVELQGHITGYFNPGDYNVVVYSKGSGSIISGQSDNLAITIGNTPDPMKSTITEDSNWENANTDTNVDVQMVDSAGTIITAGGAVVKISLSDPCFRKFGTNYECTYITPRPSNIFPTRLTAFLPHSGNGIYQYQYQKPAGGKASLFAELYFPGKWFWELYPNTNNYDTQAIVIYNNCFWDALDTIENHYPQYESSTGHSADTLRIKGYLLPPVTATYTFYYYADDYGTLKIGNTVVVNNPFPSGIGCGVLQGSVSLQANIFYVLDAKAIDTGGGEALYIHWEYPGQARQQIPPIYFWYGKYITGNPITVNDCTAQCTKCKNYICEVCNSGYISLIDPATGKSKCYPQCGAGKYIDITNPPSCINCPADKVSSKLDSISINDCIQCPDGQFAPAGSSVCSNCFKLCKKCTGNLQNQCTDCWGYPNTLALSGTTCSCEPRAYLDLTQADPNYCVLCEPRYFHDVTSGGVHSCQECQPGSYSNDYGVLSCTKCELGKAINLPKQLACTACLPGFFADVRGLTDCKECIPGKYQPDSEKDSCLDCPVGTYNPYNKQIICSNCPKGTHNTKKGSILKSECDQCLANTYSSTDGAENCTPCPPHSSSDIGSITCNCDSNAYLDMAQAPDFCPLCHSFCENCHTNDKLCTKCKNIPGIMHEAGGTQCNCQVNSGYFIRKDTNNLDECVPCHPMCKKCHGTSFYECDECWSDINLIDILKGTTCNCIDGYFYDNSKLSKADYCQPCHNFCRVCITSYKHCTICKYLPGVFLNGFDCQCGGASPEIKPYKVIYNTTLQEDTCIRCHSMCLTCFGPYPDHCNSCDASKGSIQVDGTTICTCPAGKYFDTKLDACAPCHSLCKTCIGPGSTSCTTCHELALSVEDQTNVCTMDCIQLNGYYKDGKICRKCSSECASCLGGTSADCITCSDLSLVQFQGQCKTACPERYFPSNGICVECHKSCLTCVDGTKQGCTSCPKDSYLYNNECYYNRCPDKTFLEHDNICQKCEPPCETCAGYNQCLTCSNSYYKITSTKPPTYIDCVSISECPENTYPDNKLNLCNGCHKSCATCNGPTASDCIKCDYLSGYWRSGGKSTGICEKLTCLEGMYIKVDLINKMIYCEKCDSTCSTCDTEGSAGCLQCVKGRLAIISEIKYSPIGSKMESVSIKQNHFYCKTCKEINVGWEEAPGKEGGNDASISCREICGDGKNLGQYECDDGNSIDGDGCSSQCKIEAGFACKKNLYGRDICYDIDPPIPTLIMSTKDILLVEFNEDVFLNAEFSDFVKSLNLTLINTKVNCPLDYEVQTIAKDQVFTKFTISVMPHCQLRGSGSPSKTETYVLNFNSPSYITDKAKNAPTITTIKTKAKLYKYIPASSKEVVSATGVFFSAASYTTMALSLGIILFQSVGVGSFWSLVNILQIISYIPVIDCYLPPILEIFLTQYLTMGKLVLPFSLFPDWIPNPLGWMSDMAIYHVTENFLRSGFNSMSFLYNFADQLFTWLILALIYTILKFICLLTPKNRCDYFRKWKEEYEYNAIFRVLIECFLQLTFCALLNILDWSHLNSFGIISLIFASLSLYFSMWFCSITIFLLERPASQLTQIEFTKHYGTLVEGLNLSGSRARTYWIKAYYPLFLIRRLFYSSCLVALMSFPKVQLLFTFIFLVVPMFSYLLYYQPFDTRKDNLINLYNEGVLVITFLTLFIIQFFNINPRTDMIIGWGLVGLILLSLLLTWILILPPLVKMAFSKCRSIFYKKTATKSAVSLPFDASPSPNDNRRAFDAVGRSTFMSADRPRTTEEPEIITEINSQETPRPVQKGNMSPHNGKDAKSARSPKQNNNEALRKDSNVDMDIVVIENEGKIKKKKSKKGKKKKKGKGKVKKAAEIQLGEDIVIGEKHEEEKKMEENMEKDKAYSVNIVNEEEKKNN